MLHTVILVKSFLAVCVLRCRCFFSSLACRLWYCELCEQQPYETIYSIYEQIICVDTVKMGNALKFP